MEYSKQYVKKPEVLCAFRVGYDEPYEKGFLKNLNPIHVILNVV